jgi:nucleoside-diphosphate-sugar epimerase
MMVLVLGGSGDLGAPVAQQLRGDGFQVRLLVRNRGRVTAFNSDFDYAYGDVDDSASLQVALAGCDAMHVSVRGGPTAEQFDRVEHRGTARVAELAAREGVQRISYVSHSLAASDASAPIFALSSTPSRRSLPAACRTRSSDRHTSWRPCRGRSGALQESGERGDPTEATRLLSAPSITLTEWCERRLP